MPPRWLTWCIIAFWLGTTAWMVQRELSWRLRAAEAPPFSIDLTDEVGANTISWNVLANGDKVGTGKSWVRRRPDLTFQLFSEFKFFDVPFFKKVKFRKVASMYRVSAEGELREVRAQLWLTFDFDVDAEITGRVENDFFIPRLRFKAAGTEVNLPLEKIKIAGNGNIVNQMHLINKINGLKDGQHWVVNFLKPLEYQDLFIPRFQASATADHLVWNGKEVPCFRIDYGEPGEEASARTWVRQRDGLVLRQEAEHQGRQFVLEREK